MNKYNTYLDLTATEIQELVERATPKKPFVDCYGRLDKYCSTCHSKRPMILTNINARPKFCRTCGQALDWSNN